MSMTETSVSLPKDLEDYLHEQIGKGRFADASDFMRTMLRADRTAYDRLDDILQDGFNSGVSEFTFEEIIDRARDRLQSRAA
jgi:putative addiction module CopG family antidote